MVEVCKNLVLAGIHSLVLLDASLVQQHDLGANFFLLPEHIGQPVCGISLVCTPTADN